MEFLILFCAFLIVATTYFAVAYVVTKLFPGLLAKNRALKTSRFNMSADNTDFVTDPTYSMLNFNIFND